MRRSGGEHVGNALGLIRMGRRELRSEPARDGSITQADHGCFAVTLDHLDARIPHFRPADLRRSVTHHQLVQPVVGVDAKPLADQPAHGQAAEMRLLNRQTIEQRQHIPAQLLDAVLSGRYQRLTMPAGVVAQHTKVPSEDRHLGVPHVQISAQRVGQHQHRRIDRSFQLIMQFTIGQL